MAMSSIEPDLAILEGPHARHLERSTLMKNALALYHSDEIYQKERKS